MHAFHLSGYARGLLVALAILALSAGAAMAGRSALTTPSAAGPGLEQAATSAGKSVPVVAQVVADEPVADEDDAEDGTEELVDQEPADDTPAADTGERQADTHGLTVSTAAKGPTPNGFDNHGQYVRSIATVNHGSEASAAAKAAHTKQAKPTR